MKLLIFLGGTIAYVLLSWVAVMLFLYRWWSAPSDGVQQQGALLFAALAVVLLVGYVVGSIWFWFWR